MTSADERTIVRLDASTPLPCSIMTADGPLCGKPATVAHARPLPPTGPWAVPGLWELQPVCAECTALLQAHYAKED